MASEKKSPDAFEATLKRELQKPSLSNAAECPAPDVLAAYYDRALSQAERARVDSHLTSCARCLSMTASIARADDTDHSRVPRDNAGWFFWVTRLLTPVAAVGVVVAIAFSIRTHQQRAPEVIALASPVAPMGEFAARAPAPPPVAESRALAVAPAASPPASPPDAPAPVDEPRRAARAKIAKPQNLIATEQEKNPSHEIPNADVSSAESNPSAASSLSEYSLASKPASATGGAGASVSGSSAASAMGSEAPGGAAASGSEPGFIIVHPRVYSTASPDGSVVWSFGSQGVISRSENSAPPRLTHQIRGELLGGSAPSNDVCWIVGKSGAILRTLDRGAHWQIVKPPLQTDFTGVSATDSNNATVVALYRHSYVTHDGGVTWAPQ